RRIRLARKGGAVRVLCFAIWLWSAVAAAQMDGRGAGTGMELMGTDAPGFFAIDVGLVLDFLPGETSLDPEDQEQLHELVRLNKKGCEVVSAVIVSWGDEGASTKPDTELAQERADAVSDFLRSQYKITNTRIVNMEVPIEEKRRATKEELA